MKWLDLYRRSLRLHFDSPTEKAVWMALVSFADPDGRCWPAIESRHSGKLSLASVSGLSPRVISKWLAHFVRLTLISRQQRARGSYYQLNLAEAERAFGAGDTESESGLPECDSSKRTKPINDKDADAERRILESMLGEQRTADLLEVRNAKGVPNTPGSLRALINVLRANRDAGADLPSLVDKCIRHGWVAPKEPRKSSVKTPSSSSRTPVSNAEAKLAVRQRAAEYLGKLEAIDSDRSRNRRDLLRQSFPAHANTLAAVFHGEGPGLRIFCASPVQKQPLEELVPFIIPELSLHGEPFAWATVEIFDPRLPPCRADGL